MAVFYAERSDMEKRLPKSTILGDSVEGEIIAKSLPYVPNTTVEIPVFTALAIKDLQDIGVIRKKIYMRKPKDY
jgi:hypothetical protein